MHIFQRSLADLDGTILLDVTFIASAVLFMLTARDFHHITSFHAMIVVMF